MQDCNSKGLYVQGVYDFEFYSIGTDELLFQSRYITESNITTSTNLNAIKGGIGNATLIQIPSDAELKVQMTAQNFTLEGLGLNTGATIMPNGIYRVSDEVTLEAQGKLVDNGVPVYRELPKFVADALRLDEDIGATRFSDKKITKDTRNGPITVTS